MEDLLKSVDNLPLIVKLILCIPGIDLVYSVLRIIKGVTKGDVLWIVLGVVTVVCCWIWWLLDIIWVLWKGHALLLGETYLG